MNAADVARLLEPIVKAVFAGEEPDSKDLVALLGYAPSGVELAVLSNQLRTLSRLSLPMAIEAAAEFLQSAKGSVAALLRAKQQLVEELFQAVGSDPPVPLSLRVRKAFGVTNHRFEEVLVKAVAKGALSREEALACIDDGENLTKKLSALAQVSVPVHFRTVDSNEMPATQHGLDAVIFQESVELKTLGGASFNFLITNETELAVAVKGEQDTKQWLEDTIRNDSVFYDVGAHVGYYSLYAASVKQGARAVGFEPSPANFARLNENLSLNRDTLEHAVAFPMALSDVSGVTTFGVTNNLPGGWGHRGIDERKDTIEWNKVQADGSVKLVKKESLFLGCVVYSLDDFLAKATFLRPPTHLKIDVDGPELKVLAGARKTLEQPGLEHLLVEFRDDAEAIEAEGLLGTLGFRLVSPPAKGFGNRIFRRQP